MASPISVITPAYNEAERLGETLRAICDYLAHHFPGSELIVVDDGSTDETVVTAKQAFARAHNVQTILISNPLNRGKGHAVRTGLLAARNPTALFSDADLSTPITEMPKLISAIQHGCHVAVGSRAIDRNLIGVRQPWRREQGGRAFNAFVRLATGLPFWDTQCGFKAFDMGACRPIIEAATIDRFGFDVELLYVAHLAGLRLEEKAVRWNHYEGSKVDILRDSRRMFSETMLIRRQARRGVYDKAIRAVHSSLVRKKEMPVDFCHLYEH